MKKLLLLFTLLPFLSNAQQQTYVPDDAFEQALIYLGYDTVLDNYVTTANINGVTFLELSMIVVAQYISDLTGIEDFTALENLDCRGTQLTSLDLSNNTALTELACGSFLGSIGGNQLTSLDLSNNTALTMLRCDNNQLTCLNLKNGNNINMTVFQATNNPNLTCIEVDDSAYSTTNWTDIGSQTSFSTNCNYPANCFSTPTSLQENTNNISLFPNPTNDLIALDINGYNGSVNVEVFDLSGRLLKSTNNTTVSLKDYTKGIYVFKISYGDRVEELKVVKD
jgi:hypothetical protein